jgi:hypothetical protein
MLQVVKLTTGVQSPTHSECLLREVTYLTFLLKVLTKLKEILTESGSSFRVHLLPATFNPI